ncbi:MAG TPA: hypothetical protein VER04_09370 [Polyangiaceae bacterium]|nr:hypothetical protein [Polyangiaceae bacterium]
MTSANWFLGLGLVLCTACTSASGALGPQGYEQSLTKYRVNYADASRRKFLPDDWALDNYTYDPAANKWHEKDGVQYRAVRRLDEDGDGTVSRSERHEENLFDLRFVHSRDGAVIWLKVHPMEADDASRDLEVILESYADGLEGTGLFEQSTLFGLEAAKARHYTTFTVKKESLSLGALPAIRGVIEIADVEKLRLDPTHRDSKAELIFAKVTYLERVGISKPSAPRWPIVATTTESAPDGQSHTVYSAQRTGLLVIGYYDDAKRFESHLADLHALVGQLVIPASAVPPNSALPELAKAASLPQPAAPAAAAPGASAAPATAPAATGAPPIGAPPTAAPPTGAPPTGAPLSLVH